MILMKQTELSGFLLIDRNELTNRIKDAGFVANRILKKKNKLQ